MAALRIATFNCENLLSRARLLNFASSADASPSLDKLGELNGLIAKDPYSDADRASILALLRDLKGYINIEELRGKLLGKKAGKDIVKANGRGDWIGGVTMVNDDLPTEAQKNTARVITEVHADVQILVEVESRLVLEEFNRHWLKPAQRFPFNMLVDGNDERGIDVGLFSRLPIADIRTHIFDANAKGNRIFSRDCLEVTLTLQDQRPVTILLNHLKSQGYGTQTANDARRKEQADRIAQILARYDLTKDLVVVAGDFNDVPTSAPLQGLLATPNLHDVLELKFGADSEQRWTYHYQKKTSQIDYLLVSAPLKASFADAGIERRGIYKVDALTGGAVTSFSTVTKEIEEASDHAAVWADFNLV